MTTLVTWNTTVIDGRQFLVIDLAKFMVPLDWDPSSNMFLAVGVPDGGFGNLPVLLSGSNGLPPDLDTVIDFTPLADGDPTADFAFWVETAPNVYKLHLGLHTGQRGLDGNTILDPNDFADPLPGYFPAVNPGINGFDLVPQKVGDCYWPSTFSATPSGNSAWTLCPVPIPAQPFDWRPEVEGFCVVTPLGSNVRVDLIARLQIGGTNVEATGNEVGRARGVPGLNPPTHVLSSGPPPDSNDAYNRVPAGSTAIVYYRAERQAGGSDFFTTPSTYPDINFKVRVCPVP